MTRRTADTVHAVNALAFHPQRSSCFLTAGSDGWCALLLVYPLQLCSDAELHSARSATFWDKQRKARTSQLQQQAQPITAVAFSADGTVLAYASGYDWRQGAAGLAGAQHSILLHRVRCAPLAELGLCATAELAATCR